MYFPGCEVYEETLEPEEAKKPMSFRDWLKNLQPERIAYLDGLANEAEDQRERDEDIAWDEYCNKEA